MPMHQTARTFGARRVPTPFAASGCWQLGEVTQAQRDLIWPVSSSDPFFPNVSLLLTDSLSDDSLAQTPITSSGVVLAQGPAKLGTSSIHFTSGASVATYQQSTILFQDRDFTVETWVYFPNFSTSSQYAILAAVGAGPRFNFFNGVLRVARPGTVITASSALNISNNTWYHVALTRTANTYDIYLDGALVTSGSRAEDWTSLTDYETSQGEFYLDGLRVTDGAARYSGTFTPPVDY